MLKIINESKKTNVKDLEMKGQGNEIRLCSYDIDNDGITRYCVLNIRDNKVKWANNYDEAKEFFDNLKIRRRHNDSLILWETWGIIFSACDTFSYGYSDDYEGDKIPLNREFDTITYRDFRHAEMSVNRKIQKGDGYVLLTLSKKDKEVLSEVVSKYLYEGRGSEDDDFTEETLAELVRLFPNDLSDNIDDYK